MIAPRIRASINTEDFQALERAMARLPDKTALRILLSEGPDQALAHPACKPEELWSSQRLILVRTEIFLYAIVRHMVASTRMEGAPDPAAISDYVATVISDFAVGKRAWSADALGEHPVTTIAGACEAADCGIRGARQHAGNLALWLGGLFPDRVAHLRDRAGGPGMAYYDEIGQLSFQLAGAEAEEIADIMNALATDFASARRGLNTIADTILFREWRQARIDRMLKSPA